jgi:hypothetical protein
MNAAIKKRRLKVYYGHHSSSYRQHPVIRLAGKYLSNLDFKIGDTIELTMELGRISITKLPKM